MRKNLHQSDAFLFQTTVNKSENENAEFMLEIYKSHELMDNNQTPYMVVYDFEQLLKFNDMLDVLLTESRLNDEDDSNLDQLPS
jgi:uncharacterized Fe-S cluster-containing MiaB family protein